MEYFYQSSKVNKKLKLIILGDTGVGKTTMISRFTDRELPGCIPTIGCNFSLLKFEATETEPEFVLDIWDTAGQERYHSILDLYFQNVDICLLVYDVNDKTSLIRLFEVWLPRYLNSKYKNDADYQHKVFYLIGNKDDKEQTNPKTNHELRQVLNQHRDVIKEYQIRLWTVSALQNQYLEELLEDIRKSLINIVIPFKSQQIKEADGNSEVIKLVNEVNGAPKNWLNWMTSNCRIL